MPTCRKHVPCPLCTFPSFLHPAARYPAGHVALFPIHFLPSTTVLTAINSSASSLATQPSLVSRQRNRSIGLLCTFPSFRHPTYHDHYPAGHVALKSSDRTIADLRKTWIKTQLSRIPPPTNCQSPKNPSADTLADNLQVGWMSIQYVFSLPACALHFKPDRCISPRNVREYTLRTVDHSA
jgi:hypothetical protein